MANYSLLIHPITSLPPNREPTEGWPWLSSWTVSITWPRPFRGGPHGDSWPFFRIFSQIFGQENLIASILHESWKSLYMDFFLNKCRYLFFHGMMVVSSKLYVVCFLHFKGYHLPGPGYPIPPLLQFVTSETLGGHLWYTSIRYVLFWSRCDLTKFGDYEIRGLIGSLVGWLVDVCNYIFVDIGWGSKKMELA